MLFLEGHASHASCSFRSSSARQDILNSMTHQMQEISALFAVTSISEFTHWPSLATDVNLAAIESFPSALELRLDRIIELFWGEISKRFNHVDYLGYGDRTGVFIGLERLPKEFTAAHDFDGHFGGEQPGLETN